MRNLINDAGINYKDLDGLVYGLLVIAINNISEVKNDQSFITLFDFFVNGFGLEASSVISFNSTRCCTVASIVFHTSRNKQS